MSIYSTERNRKTPTKIIVTGRKIPNFRFSNIIPKSERRNSIIFVFVTGDMHNALRSLVSPFIPNMDVLRRVTSTLDLGEEATRAADASFSVV